MSKEISFAGFPFCKDISQLDADIAVIGIPYGTPYRDDEIPHSLNAPGAIRRESIRYCEDPIAWDFDLNAPLKELCGGRAADCGDLPGSQDDPVGNFKSAQRAIQKILEANAVPIVLGGDDSVPIPVMRAYEGWDPFYILQLDAHIDWRDEVRGVRDGYSSTMRRASEMPWVKGIVQVGMRAVGSARRKEYEDAIGYGAELTTTKQFHQEGLDCVLEHIPAESKCFITIDLDALDPSIMPAVGALTPGGLFYQETIDLIHAVSEKCQVVGACVIGLAPEDDVNNIGTITTMRIVWNLIGALAARRTE